MAIGERDRGDLVPFLFFIYNAHFYQKMIINEINMNLIVNILLYLQTKIQAPLKTFQKHTIQNLLNKKTLR
jgi:hypothetical protein